MDKIRALASVASFSPYGLWEWSISNRGSISYESRTEMGRFLRQNMVDGLTAVNRNIIDSVLPVFATGERINPLRIVGPRTST